MDSETSEPCSYPPVQLDIGTLLRKARKQISISSTIPNSNPNHFPSSQSRITNSLYPHISPQASSQPPRGDILQAGDGEGFRAAFSFLPICIIMSTSQPHPSPQHKIFHHLFSLCSVSALTAFSSRHLYLNISLILIPARLQSI